MIAWSIFFVIAVLFITIEEKTDNKNFKYLFRFLLIFLLVYVAGFRNGIGQDYTNYTYRLWTFDGITTLSFWDEPSFDIVADVINSTSLSYVFYFLLMSIITLVPLLVGFYRYPKAFYIVILFLLFPGCGYFQTFNLVRQFAAIPFILMSMPYLAQGKYWKFFGLVLCATFFHKASIFLLFIPLLLYFPIEKTFFSVGLLVFSLVTRALNFSVSNISTGIERYDHYFSDNETKAAATIFYFITACFIYILVNFSQIYEQLSNDGNITSIQYSYSDNSLTLMRYILILGYFCVLFYNLSGVNYVFARFAVFFSPMMFISLAYPLFLSEKKWIYAMVTFIVFFFLFFYSIIGKDNNILLPLDALFDN